MKPKNINSAVFVTLCLVLIFCTACPRKPQIYTRSRPPILLPKGAKNAETGPAEAQMVTVSVPSQFEFYVGPEQYAKEQVGEKLSRVIAGQNGADKIVYVAGSYSLDYGVVASIVDTIRREGVNQIGLLVEPAGGGGPNVLRVQVLPEPSPNDDLSKLKPNPQMLVASVAKDLKLELNRTAAGEVEDPANLVQTLTRIFQQRKDQHAYSPGMLTRNDVPEDDRVEKTVTVKAQRSTRYVDVIRLIDAVKGAGAKPIILQIDDLSE